MPSSGTLVAWIELRGDDQCLAAFVGAYGPRRVPTGRAPATQLCSSQADARQWVEDQATALGLPVEWLAEAPRG
jgi:hypothetical protein